MLLALMHKLLLSRLVAIGEAPQTCHTICEITTAVACQAQLQGNFPEERLSLGYSASKTIQQDLTPYTPIVLHDSDKDRVAYAIKRVDDELLEAIRADLGVAEVWRASRVRLLS